MLFDRQRNFIKIEQWYQRFTRALGRMHHRALVLILGHIWMTIDWFGIDVCFDLNIFVTMKWSVMVIFLLMICVIMHYSSRRCGNGQIWWSIISLLVASNGCLFLLGRIGSLVQPWHHTLILWYYSSSGCGSLLICWIVHRASLIDIKDKIVCSGGYRCSFTTFLDYLHQEYIISISFI